ncbi:hypothetical protein CRE_23387 [Caenorhabditis remanei]|uniref:Uncharacterized protein n=1 Tax=Caenorhabditis remanei TaxID=31234 RepID=E3MH85_CAERE|nr:hypothetical protein CRE_23387 [Caenorhabditis remanei]
MQLTRSQESSLNPMSTKRNSEICSVPFCTADISRYQCEYYHPKTELKICRTCYYPKRTAINKSQPNIVCAPDTNPPVLIDEPSKNHKQIGSGSQVSSLDPMSTFLADVSRIYPTIDSIEDAFDHSDFYDHSSHDHVSGSNKNRYAATGNQEENSDIIATVVSNCFTNANLFPEIEISDHRLMSNSEICSVPFCTADLSRYQYNFYHPKTKLKACLTCYYSKRCAINKSQPNIVCAPDTIPVLIDEPSKNQDKTAPGSQESSLDPTNPFLTDVSSIYPTIDSIEDAFDHSDFYDHSSHDHVSGSNKNWHAATGNQDENFDIIATYIINCFTNANLSPEIESSDHRLMSNSEICSVPFCTADLSRYQCNFYHPKTMLKICRTCYYSKRCAINKSQPNIVCAPDTNPPVLIDEPSKNQDKIESGSQESSLDPMSTKRNSEICSVPFCTADLSRYQCNFYHTKTKLRVCLPCSRFFWKHKRDRSEAELSDTCSKCKVKTKKQYCLRTQLPLCSTCYYSQRYPIRKSQPYIFCEPDTNILTLIDELSKNHENIGSGSEESSNLLPEIEISDHRLKSNSETGQVNFTKSGAYKSVHSEPVSKQVNFKSQKKLFPFSYAAPQLVSDVCEEPIQKPKNTLFKKEKPIRRMRQIQEISDEEEKQKKVPVMTEPGVCSIPVCKKFIPIGHGIRHPSTQQLICRSCFISYKKYGVERTIQQVFDECTNCKINRSDKHHPRTGEPLCSTCYGHYRRTGHDRVDFSRSKSYKRIHGDQVSKHIRFNSAAPQLFPDVCEEPI